MLGPVVLVTHTRLAPGHQGLNPSLLPKCSIWDKVPVAGADITGSLGVTDGQ